MNFDFTTPPDTNLSVGATQVVQIINSRFAVFSKSTGSQIYGPAGIHTVFAALGGTCGTSDGYDPAVLYDKMAGRWLISDANNPLLCVAVSQTSDATGAYNLYSFNFGGEAPDYQKFGVWPDGYYLSVNSQPGEPVGVCAFPRSAMIAGNAVTQGICFPSPPNEGFALPSDLDGSTPPSSGEPNFYLDLKIMEDSSGFSGALNLYRFHVDFTTPSNSTFTGPFSVNGMAPIFFCGSGGGGYLPQPGISQQLVADCGLLMYRLAYRNFGSHESLVINHTAQVTSQTSSVSPTTATQTGIRWYEIRDPNGTPTVFQQGTYAPDTTTYRWNGSAAQDRDGNIAVGYSVSDAASVYPGMRYAGRLATDPLNSLEAETTIVNGMASQTNSNRWGDYSSMSIDPVDDCTFWYTSEYIPLTTGWSTRIASFKFNSCGADFTMSAAPAAQSLLPGGAGKFALTLTATGGFSDAVNLSCAKLPAGAECAFDSSPVTPKDSGSQATLTVTTPPTLAQGNYAVTIAAASGGLQHTQDVQIAVGGISGSMTPSSATIAVGGSADFAVSLHSSGGFSGPVNLACGGAPSGISCNFAPAQFTMTANAGASSTLTVQVSAKPSVSMIPRAPQSGPGPSSYKLLPLMSLGVALLLAVFVFGVTLRSPQRPKNLSAPGFAACALVLVLAIGLLSCGGATKSSAPSGTATTSGTGSSGATGGSGGTSGGTGTGGSGGGGTGGTGGSNSITTQFAVQAQSSGATVNLGTISITVP